MARPHIRLTNLPVAAIGVATVGLGAAALTLGNGDAAVERGFERALATMGDRDEAAKTTATAVSGSEQFWLKHVVHDAGAPASKPVSVGDSITITSDGRDRVLHVVNVDKLDSSLVLTSSERPSGLLLVTCRDQSDPESRPVRFIIEADDDLPTLTSAKTARAL